MQQIALKLCNTKGLHARAAAKFTSTVADYDCQVKVSYNGKTVDGVSIIQLMLLATPCGEVLDIEVSGDEEDMAVEALTYLVESGFGEK